jgi:hypothetical protein
LERRPRHKCPYARRHARRKQRYEPSLLALQRTMPSQPCSTPPLPLVTSPPFPTSPLPPPTILLPQGAAVRGSVVVGLNSVELPVAPYKCSTHFLNFSRAYCVPIHAPPLTVLTPGASKMDVLLNVSVKVYVC